MKSNLKYLNNIKQNYPVLDLTKFIMAFFVVAGHTLPILGSNNTFLNNSYTVVTNLAVPFFFICSGFLLSRKLKSNLYDKNNIVILKKSLLKFIKLYVLWSVIYFPLAVSFYRMNGFEFKYAIFDYLRGFFLVGEHYNSWILWYILATIYTLILIIILIKLKARVRVFFVVGIAFLFLGAGIDFINCLLSDISILNILKQFFYFTIINGRIFQAPFLIIFGLFFTRLDINKVFSFVVFVASIFVSIIFYDKVISQLLVDFCSPFLFCLLITVHLRQKSVYIKLRFLSKYIFFTHLWIWTIYYWLVYGVKTFGIDCFIATSIFSIILSLLIGLLYFARNKILKLSYRQN